MSYLFDWILGRKRGFLIFSSGNTKSHVFLKFKPNKVWISGESESCPVYEKDHDFIAVELVKNGFVVFAEIKSNIFRLDWIAK